MIHIKATFLFLFVGLVATVLAAVNTTQEFYVVSKVLDGGPKKFDGLYLSIYHTGAGTNDVVFEGKVNASKAFINETQLQWDLGTPDIPWGTYLTSAANYAAWQFTTVNTGYGNTGFSLSPGVSGHNSITLNSGQWAGWIACDWWHGVPQLFYQYAYIKYPLPESCAVVGLFPEFI